MFFKTKLNTAEFEYSKQCKTCYCNENGDSKQCFTCEEIKTVVNFDRTSINKDGLSCYCKTCTKIKRDADRSAKKMENISKYEKECTKCKVSLTFNKFFKKFSDGDAFVYYDECEDCFTPTSLQCNKCFQVQNILCFSKDCTKRTGHRTICKSCVSEYNASIK